MSYEDIDTNAKRLFFYLLKMEEGEGVQFKQPNGDILFLDYTDVDWKLLSQELIATMGAMPKTMSVYIGNEPVNMADIGYSVQNRGGPGMEPYIVGMTQSVTTEDCRGGVMNLIPIRKLMHPLEHTLDECPPAMGLYIAVKATPNQMLDYESSFARAFGHTSPAYTATSMNSPEAVEAKIAFLKRRKTMMPEVQEILSRHLKIPYSNECKLNFLASLPLVSRKKKSA